MARSTTFTSYVNMEPAKGVDASLSALERKANAMFGRISAQAQKASMSTTGTGIGQGAGNLQQHAAAERQRAIALQQTATASNAAAAASSRLTGKLMLESNAARAASASTSGLERSLRLASVAANVAQGPLGPLAGRLSAVATAVRELTGLRLGLVGVGALGAAFVHSASAAQELKSKLYPLFDSQQQVNSAFQQTIRIANSARLSLDPVVDLYSRLTLAGRSFGISQARIGRATEIAAKAAKLSGGTAQSQEAGLYQFAQGLGSGKLGGDELRSVSENTLRLRKALAEGLDVPIGKLADKLKELAASGHLMDGVLTALESQSSKLDAEMAKLPATISSASARLGNAYAQMINGGDEAYGITRTLAGGLGLLADNLGTVTRAAFDLAAAYTVIKTAKIVSETYQAVSAWNAARVAILDNKAAILSASQEQLSSTSAARTASVERIKQLRAERAEIQANIVANAESAAVTRSARNDLTRKVDGSRYLGRSLDVLALKKVTDDATVAEQRLTFAQDKHREVSLQLHQATQGLTAQNLAYRNALMLSNVSSGNYVANMQTMRASLTSLRAETGSLITAKMRLRDALNSASKSAGFFAAAGKSLAGILGPLALGIALSVGIELLTQFAFREDAAAHSADRMAAAQDQMAKFIDLTTGAIIEQNKALVFNEALTARKEAKKSKGDYEDQRRKALNSADDINIVGQYGNSTTISGDTDIKKILAGYRPGDPHNNTSALVNRLAELRLKKPSASGDIDAAVVQLTKTTTLARETASKEAYAATLESGTTATAENRRHMAGNFTGQDIVTPGSAPAGTADNKLAGARGSRAKATNEAAAAEAALNQATERTDKRTDILSRYSDQATGMVKAAKAIRELKELVGKNQVVRDQDGNPVLGADKKPIQRKYTETDLSRDEAKINEGALKPIHDAIEQRGRELSIQKLRLQGYEDEANVLERVLAIQESMGPVSKDQLQTMVDQEKSAARLKDAYDSRQRQMSEILDLANQTRDSFSNMLVGIMQGNGADALKQFGQNILNNIMQGTARRLTESLFAGADQNLRDLLTGSSGVDQAYAIAKDSIAKAADLVPTLGEAAKSTADDVNTLGETVRSLNSALGGGIEGLAPTAFDNGMPKSFNDSFDATLGTGKLGQIKSVVTAVTGISSGVMAGVAAAASAANDNSSGSSTGTTSGVDANGQIVVAATRPPVSPGPIPSTGQGFAQVFKTPVDKFFDNFGIKLSKKTSEKLGNAFDGVGKGLLASGIVGLTGLKQNSTAAAIGGAIGNVILPGIGGAIGGAIFGTIGGLFMKTKTGSVSLGKDQFGYAGIKGTGGNDAATTKAVSGLGGSVNDQLNQIADAFGGGIGSFNVSIGKRGDEYRVNGGGGETTGKKANGSDIVYKGKDEQAAIAAAVQNAIEDGAISGISAAAQKILQSGQNLQTAITKALAIESIPKRLMQKTDPIRHAVTQLNQEFTKLIAYLKEGGATAAQFADASKLYEMERVDAIKQATSQSIAAIQAYMDEMKGGASSPFNKLTVYENAAAKLATYRGDIAAGKVVDQNDLLTASKNFQDASQKLNGSSDAFFNDFNDLFQLLTKARDNASGTGMAALPDSPFNTTDMASYLSQLNQSTLDQTGTLGGKLDAIYDALRNGYYDNGSGSSYTMGLLPGMLQAA